MAAILEFYFRFWFRSMYSHRHVILHLANFVVIGRSSAEIWRHIDFSRWRPWSQKCTPGFRFSDGICLRKWKSYLHTKCRWDNSIHGWDITTFGFGKRRAAILEFYFRFVFRSRYSHRHFILHLHAKYRSNRTILGGVMTLYSFVQDGDRQPY